jgi:hypothetical protein
VNGGWSRAADAEDSMPAVRGRRFLGGPSTSPLPGNAEGSVTILDRIFGWLLVVGGLLHAVGSWHAFHDDPPQLLWALSGSLAALLVAALNLLRVGRPNDRPLAWVSFAASVAWVAVALGFGAVIGHLADPRAVIHAVNAAVLAGLSLRTLIGTSRAAAAQ